MIMVVTYHEEFREQIFSFLSEKGYEVCVPAHRQDVVPLMQEKSPLVVVLDMYVTEPNGLEVLRKLRAQSYSGKVVALAGTSVSSLMSQALQLGVDQVIGGFQGSGGALNLDQVESAIKMALHPSIAKRAFELYEVRGQTKGNDLEDWFEAERQIFQKNVPFLSGGSDARANPNKGLEKATTIKKNAPLKS